MTNLKELRINIEKFPEALHNTLKDAKYMIAVPLLKIKCYSLIKKMAII